MEQDEPRGCLCYRRRGRKAPGSGAAKPGVNSAKEAKGPAPEKPAVVHSVAVGLSAGSCSNGTATAPAGAVAPSSATAAAKSSLVPAPAISPATVTAAAAPAVASVPSSTAPTGSNAQADPHGATSQHAQGAHDPTQIAPPPRSPTRAPLHPPTTVPHPYPHAPVLPPPHLTPAEEPAAALLHDALRTLSTSSRASQASTAYFSAGGWSHFGDDGEWLGPPHVRASASASTREPEEPHQAGPDDQHRRLEPGALAAGNGVGGSGGGIGGYGSPGAPGAAQSLSACAPASPVAFGGSEQQPLDQGKERSRTAELGTVESATVIAEQALPPQGGTAAAAAAAAAAASAAAAALPAAPADAAEPSAAAEGDADADAGASALLDRVTELYCLQGRPCKACQALLSYCKARGVAPESLRGKLRERELPDAEGLAKMAQSVSAGLADLSDDAGWQLVRDDELRLQYRHLRERGVHAFRASCELEAPVEHLVALTREVDLCPTWNKYCTSAAVLRQKSQTDVTVYMSLWVPWPFNDVGLLVEATGADLYEEEGRLMITFAHPEKVPADAGSGGGGSQRLELPPAASGHAKVRLLQPSCMTFTPLPPRTPGGAARTRAHVQCYIDPGGRHVPPFIISFVLKVFSPFMYGAVKKVLASAFRSPDDPLPQRIKQRPELYDMVRRRTQEYLASKAHAAAAAIAAK